MTPVQHVAVTFKDGSLGIMHFVLEGRSHTLPYGGEWKDAGLWTRKATDANVFEEITRTFGEVQKYRLVDESDIPADRSNRADWIDDGETIG